MGYNNRAVRLHKLAKSVVEHHQGKIPATFDALICLPGIGKYTANALLSSAFGRQLPIVDVNVQRALSRIFWRMKTTAVRRNANDIWQLAEAILPKGKAYNWNQALMDLGALICTARNPKCEACPVAEVCSSRTIMKRENVAREKREPSLNGIPNRTYRGKVIEQLRRLNGTGSLRADVLARSILPAFSKRHEMWLKNLFTDLENDGLIRIRGDKLFTTTRVSLA
jgi:A/G-specific adenine glycosylase